MASIARVQPIGGGSVFTLARCASLAESHQGLRTGVRGGVRGELGSRRMPSFGFALMLGVAAGPRCRGRGLQLGQAASSGAGEAGKSLGHGNGVAVDHCQLAPALAAAAALREDSHYELQVSIQVHLPGGVHLGTTSYGRGLFSTKAFKAGDLVWRDSYALVPHVPRRVLYRIGQEILPIDLPVHAVLQASSGKYELYGFDSFLNHSCDPTLQSWSTREDGHRGDFEMHAVRDIGPGEEFTQDYDALFWDCREATISSCGCGSASCRGRIAGFGQLPMVQQVSLWHKATPEIRRAWALAHRTRSFRVTRKGLMQ